MAATFVAASHKSAGSGGDPVLAKPTGLAVDDLLLLVGANNVGAVMTAPADTNPWNTHAVSLATDRPLFWKWADATDVALSNFAAVGVAGAVATTEVMVTAWRGVDKTNPFDDAKGNAASGSIVVATATSAGASRLGVGVAAKANANTTFTIPGTQTQRFTGNANPSAGTCVAADEPLGAGATGTRTYTPAAGTSTGVAYFLILKPGSQTVSPSGVDSTATVGSPTVTAGPVTVTPGGVNSTATVGTPAVVAGTVTVSPAGVGSTTTMGSPTVTAGVVTVSPGGVDSTALLGTPQVTPGPVTVSPDGVDSTSLLGTPSITAGTVTVGPSGIDAGATLGAPTVTAAGFTIHPDGIDSTSVVGSPTVTRQPSFTGTIRNHETGATVAGATVRLFNNSDTLIDTTVSDGSGVYLFHLDDPIDVDGYYVTATYMDGLTQVHGISDRGCQPV